MITRDQIDLADTIVAYCPETEENWTLDELIEHANGCEEQIEFLLATQPDDDCWTYAHLASGWKRVRVGAHTADCVQPEPQAAKSAEERLVAVYRELVDFVSSDGVANDCARLAARALAVCVAPLLARGKVAA